MTFLPVVERELRVASRRSGTYWTRVAAATSALVVAGLVILVTQRDAPQSVGHLLFYWMAGLVMISAASGLRVTVDCLSEEKREGTLGLLFLTDLKGYDIVFGKLVSSSLNSFYSTLAVFPILAVSLLLGGVTYGEFGRVALTAGNLLFLSLSIGLFASAVCRDERKAVTMATLMSLLMYGLFPIIGIIAAIKTNKYPESLLYLSPGYGCFLSFDVWYRGRAENFWWATAMTHLYGWLFLLLACRVVPRSWQEKAGGVKREKAESSWKTVTQGGASERKNYRTQLLEINPFYWLAARDRFKMKLVWITFFAGGILWFWGWFEFKKDWLSEPLFVITALFMHLTLKLWVATEGSRRFIDDRRNGAMELLLSTPLSIEEILRGQRLACLRQFGGPAALVVGIDVLLMFAGLSKVSDSDKGVWIAVWLSGIIVFVMDLLAMTWVAMWTGVIMHRTNRATGSAISRILALPWIAYCSIFIGYAILESLLGRSWMRRFDLPDIFFPLLWLVISVANNFFWAAHAKFNLRRRFRAIATQRFNAPPSWFERIFRRKTVEA